MSGNITMEDCLSALERAGVPPAKELATYMQKLLEWNEKINLTGAKTPDEFAVKHVADVWAAIETLGSVAPAVADIGSGCGIPGIVLGIISPETEVTLVERIQKKARVLSSIVSEMGLDRRIKILARSFEEVKTFNRDTEFWFRGVLPGPKLAVYLSEHFPRGEVGQLVLMKGPAWPEEKLDIMNEPKVKEAWLERFGSAAELNYSLPQGAGERILVLV